MGRNQSVPSQPALASSPFHGYYYNTSSLPIRKPHFCQNSTVFSPLFSTFYPSHPLPPAPVPVLFDRFVKRIRRILDNFFVIITCIFRKHVYNQNQRN